MGLRERLTRILRPKVAKKAPTLERWEKIVELRQLTTRLRTLAHAPTATQEGITAINCWVFELERYQRCIAEGAQLSGFVLQYLANIEAAAKTYTESHGAD